MDYQDYINALNEASNSNNENTEKASLKDQLEEQKKAFVNQISETVEAPFQMVATEVLSKQIAKSLGISGKTAKALAKGDVKGALKNAVQEKVDGVKDSIDDAVSDAKNTVNDAVDTAKSAVSDVKNTVSDTVDTAENVVSDAKNAVSETARTTAESARNAVQDIDEDNIWGNEEPTENTLSSLFKDTDTDNNPFSFKPDDTDIEPLDDANPELPEAYKDIPSINDDLGEDEDVFDAFDNSSSLLDAKNAEAIASRDSQLFKFEPDIPKSMGKELRRLEKIRDKAKRDLEGDDDPENINELSERLGNAEDNITAQQNSIDNLAQSQTQDLKNTLNQKLNLDDTDKLMEEQPLSEDIESTVESGESAFESGASRVVSGVAERTYKPAESLLADMMKQNNVNKVSQVAEESEAQVNNVVNEGSNAVKTGINAVENIGQDASKLENVANDAVKASQVVNKVTDASEDVGKGLNTLGKLAKGGEVLDEESLGDDWNPVGIGITLALTAGTVLAEIFGKKKEHNAPVAHESYSFQAGIA